MNNPLWDLPPLLESEMRRMRDWLMHREDYLIAHGLSDELAASAYANAQMALAADELGAAAGADGGLEAVDGDHGGAAAQAGLDGDGVGG